MKTSLFHKERMNTGFGMVAAAAMAAAVQSVAYEPAPAAAVEAEHFTIERGWSVIRNGDGNYMVDIIGFQHISGERLLGAVGDNTDARAHKQITVPRAGDYRLWVRYEYPPFTEARFRVSVKQDGRTIARKLMGARDNERYGFGNPNPVAQHDPSWGAEGLVLEVLDVPALEAGPADLVLETVEQPDTPGMTADRNIDLLYLTADTADAWWPHHARRTRLYPILDAFRDAVGPRWEMRIRNEGDRAGNYHFHYSYNRIPWRERQANVARGIAPGETSDWLPLTMQDTTHFSMVAVESANRQPMRVDLRAVGSEDMIRYDVPQPPFRVYLPSYPGMGEQPVTPVDRIREIIDHVNRTPAPGRPPTLPLTYGGWIPAGEDSDYGRAYAALYAAIGMRSLHPAIRGDVEGQLRNLAAVGIKPTRSWMIMGYRNPPTPDNIARARTALEQSGMAGHLQWYDYGDEIAFRQWLTVLAGQRIAEAQDEELTAETIFRTMWRDWLDTHRPGYEPADYWRTDWGEPDPDGLRPDSSAAAAAENPRLYVDSQIFYEQAAIDFVAEGLKQVKRAFGDHVLGGANYSAHPFYYPTLAMYVRWFRGGAADMGRHSEYFWQVTQAGPMVNGYLAEHFRAGMRHNPEAVIRQYTMPHSPGNTDASFRRTAFTHLAHGATRLDYFGIGLNETFTENYIDHRDADRYVAIRDINHAMGLVEDLLVDSHVVPSQVAMLVSDATERWDLAPIATDHAGHNKFGPAFRQVRLSYHQERLGLFKALTFLNHSPDLLIEEDLADGTLDGYRVLYVVGDCMPADALAAIRQWVTRGGIVMAMAGTGGFDPYRNESNHAAELFGLSSRTTEEQVRFMRPRQELAFLQPIDRIEAENFSLPVLAIRERITPAEDAETIGRFTDGSPAVLRRKLGEGKMFYVAGLPGVAYLWSGLQPPAVPDRGSNTHRVPHDFDPAIAALIEWPLQQAGLEPAVDTGHALIDTRLLAAGSDYVLPLANYELHVGQPVTISLRTAQPIRTAVSAHHGRLPVRQNQDRTIIVLPSLGYGDLLRLGSRLQETGQEDNDN